jgi:6-pyruvoyl-tetrahydropterin synthase
MIFAKIKSKEKKKSHTFKMTISKKDVNGVVVSVEELKELKKELLDQISFELDTFIIDMIEDKSEVGTDELVEILEDLAKIQVSEIGKEVEEEEAEEELEEVLEEKDEEK